jgi:competence protein ComEC
LFFSQAIEKLQLILLYMASARRAAQEVCASIRELALSEIDRWIIWTPVLLGVGVALYFFLRDEPSPWSGVTGLTIAASLLGAARFIRVFWLQAISLAILLVAVGFGAAQIRTNLQAAPVLQKEIGPRYVTGVVETINQRPDGSRRLTLGDVAIEDLETTATPVRVRISIRGKWDDPLPGARGRILAVLKPPPRPIAPGAFDFGRQAWFQQLGAFGYGLRQFEPSDVSEETGLSVPFKSGIERMRMGIAQHLRANLSSPEGEVAAALMVGDRSAIPENVAQDLRDAGLAHLLAISGLHMGFFGFGVFVAIRSLLALWPSIALRYPIKKWAATAALLAAFFYMLAAGASISTQRAFLMIALMFCAILIDRPALSLRAVAIAATVILLITPESLLHVGFQMSFAAVVALIAGYEALQDNGLLARRSRDASWARRLWLYVIGVALTSLIAGLATAPFAAYHFNRIAVYDLLGNLLAMPIMGVVVMPSAIMTYATMPFGLDGLAMKTLEWGIGLMLAAAHWVSNLGGAVYLTPSAPPAALGFMVVGGLWLLLWRRSWRVAGAPIMMVGFVLFFYANPPDVLIDPDLKNVAVRNSENRLQILHPRRGAYAAEMWLRRDGDRRMPAEAATENQAQCDALGCVIPDRHGRLTVVSKAEEAAWDDCVKAHILISAKPIRGPCSAPAVVIDWFDVWRNGAHGIWLTEHGPIVKTAAQVRGRRPWSKTR